VHDHSAKRSSPRGVRNRWCKCNAFAATSAGQFAARRKRGIELADHAATRRHQKPPLVRYARVIVTVKALAAGVAAAVVRRFCA
jgi:hypothetical protein